MLHSILFTTVLKPCYLTWFHSLCYSFYFLTFHLSKFIFIQGHIYLHTQLKYKDKQNSWSPSMYGSSIIIGKTECNEGNKCIIQYPQMTNMKSVGEKVETVTVYPGFMCMDFWSFGQRSEPGLECTLRTHQKKKRLKSKNNNNKKQDVTYKRGERGLLLCFRIKTLSQTKMK